MEKEFVPFKEALRLKELGFNELPFGFYLEDGSLAFSRICDFNNKIPNLIIRNTPNKNPLCIAPLYWQAFKFIRDKYFINLPIYSFNKDEFNFRIDKLKDNNVKCHHFGNYKTYEEAELYALREVLNLIRYI